VNDVELESLAHVDRHQTNRVNSIDGCGQLAQGAVVSEDREPPDPIQNLTLRIGLTGRVVLRGELQQLVDSEASLLVRRRRTGEIVPDQSPFEQKVEQHLAGPGLETDRIKVRAQQA
jgi:hypothetical protein